MTAPGGSPEQALTIAQLTNAAKEILEGAFPPIWIKGEVSNFTAHRNGHWYFSLRDATAQLSCVVWSRDTQRIPAPPDEGMRIMAHGQISVYAARGQMQFMVRAMEAEGEGLWRKAFEKTKAALQRDGLLDPARKRPLPRFPRRVAVITSPDGAALHDIISVIQRRNSGVDIVVIAAAVQGEAAPDSLVAAIERLGRWGGADVVIIGRGGGSREDLWAFNDERVARAISASAIPTISAVGHEVDFTIADFVADFRAATPSAAAEAAVPVLAELHAYLQAAGTAVRSSTERRLRDAGHTLRQLSRDLAVRSLRTVERRRARVQEAAARLEALSPLATLARGYAVVLNEKGGALPSAAMIKPGMHFAMEMRDGRVHATADEVIVRASQTAKKGAA
ncbi:MAG TPA: exodeoxyribonuclease VII large subunit [Gemmatimonadaceae bacterium]|jgi:exodeoxyribonuclease VII large subunit|nr:exodeoxyribonuclease VII large subunit [Gemmatimonadaceae bacterium]